MYTNEMYNKCSNEIESDFDVLFSVSSFHVFKTLLLSSWQG